MNRPDWNQKPLRALLVALLAAALLAGACSPEATRTRGEPGADPGNRSYPLPQLHGDQTRNNPSYGVPSPGQVPGDARGVPGFWIQP